MEDKSIDQARKMLESKLSKYSHPEKVNAQSGNRSTYQAYSEQATDVYVSQNTDVYATFDDKLTPDVGNTETCPICEERAVYRCNCNLAETMCSKGHIWRYVKGKCIQGDPHEETQ
jgi:hypothetical protein